VRIGKKSSGVIPGRSTTAARYGGEEFAFVFPEAGPDVARASFRAIRERLSTEPEHPALSVSAGVAAFPEDGDTPEKLLVPRPRPLCHENRGEAAAYRISRVLPRSCEDEQQPCLSGINCVSRTEKPHPDGDSRAH